MTNSLNRSIIFSLLLLITLILSACGGGEAGPTASPEPTKTLLPTYEYIEPTNPPVFNQNAESTDEADSESDEMELDPKLVERGLGRYEALECGICHGVDGVGTDEIGGLLDFAMEEDPFVTFMRSGGEIGNSHQYSTDRLSKNGAANLYQYLVSLAQGE